MQTFTVYLDGMYYALGMDNENVYQLETPNYIAKVGRTIQDRNNAIRSVCYAYATFKDALSIAKRSGNYVGMLFSK